MSLRPPLALLSAIFFAVSLSAQKPLPVSTEEHLATLARVDGMKTSDLNALFVQAKYGGREAEYLWALVYEQGRLLKRDFASAQIWMSRAAEQGYVPAQLGMGLLYLHEPKGATPVGDYGRAERWLRLAATQADADAQFWLGLGYTRGTFGVTDYQEALR